MWPSAYASGWLVKEYKKRGGKYKGKKPSSNEGLSRWFKEEWNDVCKLPKKVKCGRPKTSMKSWKKDYPYCRPNKKITKNTPKTAGELSKNEINRRCNIKKTKSFEKGNKETDEKETDEKETDEKETDEKETDEKETEEKETDEKGTDEKETEEKETDEKETGEQETGEKETDEKETDEKEIDEKEIDEKEINEKEIDEKRNR